ncbi:MAG: hypothetical protein ACI8Y4_003291 [Candidatus Poriferisodalaceae bacterium]|jgi:hypothetical protein
MDQRSDSQPELEPEYEGECAFAVSLGKRQVEGSPDHATVDGDKTYYFKNGVTRFLWKVLPNRAERPMLFG